MCLPFSRLKGEISSCEFPHFLHFSPGYSLFSRWRCRNLGENLQHVYTNLRLQLSKQKISEAQKPSLTDVNTSTIIWFNPQKHLGAIWHFNTRRSMKRCKIKNHKTKFEMTESENFLESQRTAVTENENCYIGSVKREYSCFRRDCLKRLRCIWNNS